MNLCSDIGKGGRDQLLIDLVEVHYFEFSSIAHLDEMLLFGGSLAVAIAVHLLLLIGFGSYTLFKGSSSRMPFTIEGGVPAGGKFLSKLASRNNGKFIRISAPIK